MCRAIEHFHVYGRNRQTHKNAAAIIHRAFPVLALAVVLGTADAVYGGVSSPLAPPTGAPRAPRRAPERAPGRVTCYRNRDGIAPVCPSEEGTRCIVAASNVRGGGAGDNSEDEEKTNATLGPVTSKGGLPGAVKGLLRRVLGAIGSLLGVKPTGGGQNMLMGDSFKYTFEAKYGKTHPRFSEQSFADATEQAWSRNRLCLVYIAADRRGGGKTGKIDGVICKALADPEVAAFVDSNFIMWVPGVKGKGKGKSQRAAIAAAAAKQVGARSLPFLGVVHSASTTDKMTLERKLKRSTVALHHCNPPPSPRQMVSWMTRVLELKKDLLETEREEQRRVKDENTIHTERVEGYSKSLKDDALREAKEAEEEAERARIEEDERQAQAAVQAMEREDAERRAQKALDLGDEPEEAGPTVSTLMLRLADGTRIRRRFLRSDVMGKVLDWADIQGVDLDAQRLSSSFPKASFSFPGDAEMTIEEAGLGKQALLFIEQKPKEVMPTLEEESSDGDL